MVDAVEAAVQGKNERLLDARVPPGGDIWHPALVLRRGPNHRGRVPRANYDGGINRSAYTKRAGRMFTSLS
jgi:hypothetical protein